MRETPHFQSLAWLLRGVGSIPGTLKLSGARLSFSASGPGNLWKGQLLKLERDAGCEALAKRLGEGGDVVVFVAPLAQIQQVRFPWYYFSGGLKLTLDGMVYRFGFDQPSNTRFSGEVGDLAGSISRARRIGKTWRALLVEEGR